MDYTELLLTERAEEVDRVRRVLDEAGIPYRTGLVLGGQPRVLIQVPAPRLEEARAALDLDIETDDEEDEEEDDERERPQPFPWPQVKAVGSILMFHLSIVALAGPWETSRALIGRFGLLRGGTLAQPWRLLTHLFVHRDPSHVMWNGIAMLVFAVPILVALGPWRAIAIYLASGIGGGLTALAFSAPGTTMIGSSGAVAGMFGAWVVTAVRRARHADLPWRARIRSLGIALLVLPALLNPQTTRGEPISVSSHMGGLATGMLLGVLLSLGLGSRSGRTTEER